jgi:hypothetical protein
LQQISVPPPHNLKVRRPIRQPHHHNRGQRFGFRQQKMIQRHHHLFRH